MLESFFELAWKRSRPYISIDLPRHSWHHASVVPAPRRKSRLSCFIAAENNTFRLWNRTVTVLRTTRRGPDAQARNKPAAACAQKQQSLARSGLVGRDLPSQ